jgi:hypothetical protein
MVDGLDTRYIHMSIDRGKYIEVCNTLGKKVRCDTGFNSVGI